MTRDKGEIKADSAHQLIYKLVDNILQFFRLQDFIDGCRFLAYFPIILYYSNTCDYSIYGNRTATIAVWLERNKRLHLNTKLEIPRSVRARPMLPGCFFTVWRT